MNEIFVISRKSIGNKKVWSINKQKYVIPINSYEFYGQILIETYKKYSHDTKTRLVDKRDIFNSEKEAQNECNRRNEFEIDK